MGQHAHCPPQSALLYAGQESHCCTGQCNAQNKKASVINISFYGHNTLRPAFTRVTSIESTIRPIAACRARTLFYFYSTQATRLYESRPERLYNCLGAIKTQFFESSLCWRRAQIEDIRVYTTSPVGYRVRQQLGMESADRICATLFALLIVLVIVREFYRQVHIEQRRSGPTAEHIASSFQNRKRRSREATQYSLVAVARARDECLDCDHVFICAVSQSPLEQCHHLA